MARVLEAVAGVHARQERHPDLTPGVIFVNPQASIWIPTLPGTENDAGTRALPEPRYAAPELLQPALSTSPDTTEERTDVYVLGMIFYELLAGTELYKKEFEQVTHSANPAFAWYDWHCDPAAEVRALHVLLPEIPEKLSRTIQRMMAKNPADRWTTIAEVIDQLNQVASEMARNWRRDLTTLVLTGRSTARARGLDAARRPAQKPRHSPAVWLLRLIAVLALCALLFTAWCRFAKPLFSAHVEASQEEVTYVR